MALKLNLDIAAKSDDRSWDPDQALADALAERAKFLQDSPKAKSYQAQIDRLLDKAGNSNNRMAVLAMLMEGKLIELSQQLKNLNAILIDLAEE